MMRDKVAKRYGAWVLLIATSAFGCNRPQSPNNEQSVAAAGSQTTQAGSSQAPQDEEARLDAMFLGEHDEPIVVDNAPIGIRLRKQDPESGGGFAWKRPFDRFRSLIIIPRDPNHDPIGAAYDTIKLEPIKRVVFVLTPANQHNGNEQQVVFTADPSAHRLTMTPPQEWWKDPNDKSGRLTPKDGSKLRLNRILYTPKGSAAEMTYPLTETTKYKHDNVEVLIIGTD